MKIFSWSLFRKKVQQMSAKLWGVVNFWIKIFIPFNPLRYKFDVLQSDVSKFANEIPRIFIEFILYKECLHKNSISKCK